MALASGIYKRYKRLFAVDDDGLRRIEGVLKKAASTYSEPLALVFHIEREDDRFYQTESIDEVLADPNVPDRRIRLLGIELRKTPAMQDGKEKDQDKVAWLVFDKDEPPFEQPDVRVRISSPDKTWALMLADELEPQITRLFKVKSFPNWVFMLFTPVIALIAYRASLWLGFAMPRPATHALFAAAGYLAILLTLSLHTAVAEKKFKLLRTIAPQPLFLWGEEVAHAAEREAFRRNFLWTVVIGFFVSLAAGVIPLLV